VWIDNALSVVAVDTTMIQLIEDEMHHFWMYSTEETSIYTEFNPPNSYEKQC